MNFNYDTGLIESLLTIDTTIASPINTNTNVLVITGTGAVAMPSGVTGDRPTSPVAGMLRFNSTSSVMEYFDGVVWSSLSVGGGTVTSVAVSAAAGGISITGSPITTSGTIDLTLDSDLLALANTASTGIYTITGSGTSATRSITGTVGTIVVTNGSGVSGDPTITLDTVGTPVSASFVKITTDTFGRVTATTPVVQSDITTLVDSVYVNVSGDTMNTGADLTFTGGGEVLGLPQTPSSDDAAASKYYVDTVAAGLSWKQTVIAATTANISLATAPASIDGVTLTTLDRVLVKDQSLPENNGIYIFNGTGQPMTRATDMDSTTPINEINGAAVFVQQGTVNADTAWVQYADVQVLGTDPILWTQFAGTGTYTAGNGLTLTGNQFSLTTPVTVANGGTGTGSTPTNGQLLIGNGTGYTLSTLTAGTAISVTNGAGSITIANTGVTSIAGTTNQITASASTGAVTLSVPATFIAPGSVEVTTTLTVDTFTQNGTLYVAAGGLVQSTAAMTNGQLLIGSTGNPPVLSTIVGGTGITVTNGAGSITIDVDNTEVVTSFSAGTTGFTPNTATTGAVTLAGTLNVANGGTGLTTTPTNGQVLIGNGTGYTLTTLTAGTGVTITNGAGTITIATAETLELYRENPSTPVTPNASGTNAVAIGSGSAATATGSFAEGDGTNARIFGMKAFANGSFGTAGDAQMGIYVLRTTTTNNTSTEMFLDGAGASQRLVPVNNSVYTFDILIAARRTDTTGGGAGYRFVGVIRKDTTAASTTFVGTPSKTVIGETDTPWDATVTANTTTGALQISVTGQTGKTVNWVATVRTTEVTN